ncbi:tRNA pseudouridine(13) synthase TruD, partial [archaeon]
LLAPRESEDAATTQVRRQFLASHTGAAAAAAALPWHLAAERSLLLNIERIGSIGVGAVTGLPPRTRSLYLHAYQSYLWNVMATHRAQVYGIDAPVVGDLVAHPDGGSDADAPRASFDTLRAVHVVTPQDVAEARFSIDQVLLPVPGYATRCPQHAAGARLLVELMRGDGFDLPAWPDAHATDAPMPPAIASALDAIWRPRWREFHLPGDYRALLATARDAEWVLEDDCPLDRSLVVTDAQALGLAPTSSPFDAISADASASAGASAGAGGEGVEEARGCAALRISFSLPKSAYATMAMRELMKFVDTPF